MRGRLLLLGFAFSLAACADAEPKRKVEMVSAPAGDDVAAIVRGELARAAGRELVVYVGAGWCEPCRRFHEAAASGKLDGAFPKLRLLEFNLDRDADRLHRAGYVSQLIPLFALPGSDGRSTGQQIEGSVKGDGAVSQIAPRLGELLHH